MLRDESGAVAAEYALIVAVFGGAIALAAYGLGFSVKNASYITAYGPNGATYRCTANCQYEYVDYCAAVSHKNDPDPATFSPALPSSAACNAAGQPTN